MHRRDFCDLYHRRARLKPTTLGHRTRVTDPFSFAFPALRYKYHWVIPGRPFSLLLPTPSSSDYSFVSSCQAFHGASSR